MTEDTNRQYCKILTRMCSWELERILDKFVFYTYNFIFKLLNLDLNSDVTSLPLIGWGSSQEINHPFDVEEDTVSDDDDDDTCSNKCTFLSFSFFSFRSIFRFLPNIVSLLASVSC